MEISAYDGFGAGCKRVIGWIRKRPHLEGTKGCVGKVLLATKKGV